MDVIYQKASTVVVWLGNATQDSPAAFKLMRQIYAVAAETTTGDCDGTMTESDLEHYKLPTRDSSYWKALDEIYWRPWFARIWIVQEIILAREAIVLCGKDRIPWSHFLIVASYIHSRNLPYLVRVDPRPPLRFNYYRHAKHFGLYTLDSLLAATRQSLSTNPLDKVYALLGISSENSIVPDYRITPCDMFRNVAKIFLLRSLDALSLVGDQVWRTTPNIPSWAPDWSYPPHEVSYLWSDLKPIFSACGNSSPIVRFSNDDKTLIVQGMILDRVNTPGASFRRHEYVIGHPLQKLYRESWEPKMFRFWERRVLRQKQYPTGEKIETVLHKLLIANADMLPNFKLKDVDLADAYAAFRRHFASFPGERRTCDRVDTETDLLYATMYKNYVNLAAQGRRIFITNSGYVGLGPVSMRPDDYVVLLSGGKTAYILRKARGASTFSFSGEAYVHGLMNGERFQGDCLLEEFAIL
jgi:hypothetical protein